MCVKVNLQLFKKKRLICGVRFSEDITFTTFWKSPKKVRGKLLSPIYLNASLLKVSHDPIPTSPWANNTVGERIVGSQTFTAENAAWEGGKVATLPRMLGA